MARPTRYLLALLVALVAVAELWQARPDAQTASVTFPILHFNLSQSGGATLPAATTPSDAMSNPISPLYGSLTAAWDGAQWVRGKAASLTNYPTSQTLTARNLVGAQLTEKSSRWMVIHNPAASSQATASIAAEASVRHVADCISFSAGSTTAPALTALTVNLRDGATGAGTIIWTHEVIASASTGQNIAPHSLCGLNLTGTTNTAMTLEFSASLANLIEAVSVSGYNVN